MEPETLVLVKPTEEYAYDARKYKDDCMELDGEVIGGGGMESFADYGDWLTSVRERWEEGELPKDKSRVETYFAVFKEDDRIIGMVEVGEAKPEQDGRHRGRITLSVRPCYRGEEYGKRILLLALKRCTELGMKEVMLSCGEDNFRAAGLILSQGGKEQSEIAEDEETRRFLITL